MIVDCHVHISACTPSHGGMSPRLRGSIPFRFMRWHFGIPGYGPSTEMALERLLVATVEGARELDAAIVVALDAVYDGQGHLDEAHTHLHITNDYVLELARRHQRILPGASVHPYRPDALRELERCVKAGAVLLKWLPVVQNFNPADPRCYPIYEMLAHYGLPLLAHTGGEKSLPVLDGSVADPALLEEALKRGVTVIAAHCGTRDGPGEPDYLSTFLRLARQYPNCYGDTAALTLPTRCYALPKVLADATIHAKLVHGSDWPILSLPAPWQVGMMDSLRLMREGNWMRRDILIKQRLGFDQEYWHRGAKLMRLANVSSLSHRARPDGGNQGQVGNDGHRKCPAPNES